MPLTEYQKASFKNHIHSQDQVLDDDGAPIDPGAGTPAASAVTFSPTGGIAATNVQTAIAELDTEKSSTAHSHGSVSSAGSNLYLAANFR